MDEKTLALSVLKKFLDSPKKIFLLDGKAGTGKTTIISRLFRESDQLDKKIVLSAPTNKAVSVLQKFMENDFKNIDFKTIHKLCKIKRKITNDGNMVFNFNESPEDEKKSIYHYDVIVVDEASMISMEIFMMLTNLSKKIKGKIIFVGDTCQLPPINEPFSKVFDPNFNYDIESFTLNRIERYKNNILKLSDRVIDSIKNGTQITLKGLKDTSLIVYKNNNEWLDTYIKNLNIENIILAFTNSRCNEINYYIRSNYHPKCNKEYVAGEIIVFNSFYVPQLEDIDADPKNKYCMEKFYTSHKDIIKEIELIDYKIEPLTIQYFLDLNQKKVINAKIQEVKEITKLKEGEIDICPICMENECEDVLETKCSHKFCSSCINTWLTENNCCPYCRMVIKQEKIIIDNDIDLSNKLNIIIEFTKDLTYNIWKIKMEKQNNGFVYVIKKTDRTRFETQMQALKKMIIDLKNYIMVKNKKTKQDSSFIIKRLWEYYYYNIQDMFADISYGYCITVHKSQGSTFNDIFVDSKNILSSSKKFKQHLKCLYTAITRGSNILHVLI